MRAAFGGTPRESIVYLNHPVAFDARRAIELLSPHGLRPPHFRDYVGAMVDSSGPTRTTRLSSPLEPHDGLLPNGTCCCGDKVAAQQPPMSWTTRDIPDQDGRVAVITGANGGLGLETAPALAAAGPTW